MATSSRKRRPAVSTIQWLTLLIVAAFVIVPFYTTALGGFNGGAELLDLENKVTFFYCTLAVLLGVYAFLRRLLFYKKTCWHLMASVLISAQSQTLPKTRPCLGVLANR